MLLNMQKKLAVGVVIAHWRCTFEMRMIWQHIIYLELQSKLEDCSRLVLWYMMPRRIHSFSFSLRFCVHVVQWV